MVEIQLVERDPSVPVPAEEFSWPEYEEGECSGTGTVPLRNTAQLFERLRYVEKENRRLWLRHKDLSTQYYDSTSKRRQRFVTSLQEVALEKKKAVLKMQYFKAVAFFALLSTWWFYLD